jgi:toxin ParE1/3/4
VNSFRLTRRAEQDLYDIFLYGYERFGITQADRYAGDTEACFQILADNPRLGREAKAIAPGVRRHEHGAHVVLYEESDTGVLILAVLHKKSVIRLPL